MGPAVIESMTAMTYGKYRVRVWTHQDEMKDRYDATAGELEGALRELEEHSGMKIGKHMVAKHLLKVDSVSAVEVTTANGDGIVVYKEWP